MKLKRTTLGLAISLSLAASFSSQAEDYVEQITIFGSEEAVDATPGSGAYISEQLEDYAITDIMRVLSSAPGVYFTEEEGYGLRPNIGMRGNSSDRSEKVTVLEDGILAAPAPYASPAAYYFPTVGRMSAVEILKGSSSAKYGPRTSGGVINLVSTAIPEQSLAGKLDVSAGSDSYRKLHAFAGGSGDKVSGVAEIFHYGADGFRELTSGQDTGFEKTDVMSKFAVYLDEDKRHNLEFKFKYSTELSDETYIGITQEDFESDPYIRYSASQLDNMDTEHKQFSVHYDYIINENLDLSVIAYRNDFHRNWYKTQKINGLSLGGAAEQAAADFDAQVRNGNNPDPIEVLVRANNRGYLSEGIQAEMGLRTDNHNMSFGLRIHADEMDRFQWEDNYELSADLSIALLEAGLPGSNSNRIDSADAISLFVQDEITFGDLTVSAGLRYEDITLERHDWKSDLARLNAPQHRENTISAVLPSLGATYQLTEEVILLAGVQKAFAPPSPGNNNAQEEEGWNYEAGARFNTTGWNSEIIGFYTDLDNLHGNCTISQGCNDDNPMDQYNAGKVSIKGIEISTSKTFSLGQLEVPLTVNYTFSNAEFKESFESNLDAWGDVEAGDEMPYLPEQMLQIETGVQGDNWKVLASLRYMDEMRIQAGKEAITTENGVDSHIVVDLSANYNLSENQVMYAVIDNLFDKEYVATKRHGGIQTGKPRAVQVGYRYTF